MQEVKIQQTIKPKKKSHPKSLLFTIILMIVAAVLLAVTLVYSAFFTKKKTAPIILDSNKYYAVFLTNGQVYFGHLSNYNTDSPLLTDIYYLQRSPSSEQSSVELGKETGQPQGQEAQSNENQNKFSLIKLGKELHGPEDAMLLNKKHILFIEELKDDGQVVKAIKDFAKKK